MRFGESKPAPYLNRKDQLRMLRLFGGLILVLVAIQFAADPKTWEWMFPKENEPAAQPKREIDFHVKVDEDAPLPPGAFRSRETPDGRSRNRTAGTELLAMPREADGEPAALRPVTGQVSVKVDRELFAEVDDNTLGIRNRERDAFFALIAHAKKVVPEALEAAGRKNVSFTVLMTDSEQFRGEPIHIIGTVHRLYWIPAVADDHGVEGYWEAWMLTEESGLSPYRVIATEVPEDMPQGDHLSVPAELTGYFFKRQGYQAQSKFYVAPVLVASRIRYLPEVSTAVPVSNVGMVSLVVGFALTIALALGITVWRFTVSDRRFGDRHVRAFIQATPQDEAGLKHLEAEDPADALRRLAEQQDDQ